jgi:hypothetical protein
MDESQFGRTEPDEPVATHLEIERAQRSGVLCAGTLACARCDAPVALAGQSVSIGDRLSCPFCLHHAPVRDFLSLTAPTRPARVVVRVLARRATAA